MMGQLTAEGPRCNGRAFTSIGWAHRRDTQWCVGIQRRWLTSCNWFRCRRWSQVI